MPIIPWELVAHIAIIRKKKKKKKKKSGVNKNFFFYNNFFFYFSSFSLFIYYSVALACAYENIKVLLEGKYIERAAKMEPFMASEMERVAKHPSVKQGRVVGMFGTMDFQKPGGDFTGDLWSPPNPAMAKFRNALLE